MGRSTPSRRKPGWSRFRTVESRASLNQRDGVRKASLNKRDGVRKPSLDGVRKASLDAVRKASPKKRDAVRKPGSSRFLTAEGRARLNKRDAVADVLIRHRWLTTIVAALTVGGTAYAAFVLEGMSLEWAIVGGVAVTAEVFLFYVLVSWARGSPVIPVPVPAGENDPAQLDDSVTFEKERQAARAAERRNLRETRGGYWIEVELPSGEWGIQYRGPRIRSVRAGVHPW